MKNDSDDDLEIDIESDSSAPPSPQNALLIPPAAKRPPLPPAKRPPIVVRHMSSNQIVHLSGGKKSEIHFKFQNAPAPPTPPPPEQQQQQPKPTSSAQQPPAPSELGHLLNDPNEPTVEFQIDFDAVTELEKYFHAEFFEGRQTKTPERYVKIRNFIVRAWQEARPAYTSKTNVRTGLKHCGDVNCISRIHSLLEQIGAINFGCQQVAYVRPLSDLVEEWFAPPVRNKYNGIVNSRNSSPLEARQRSKALPGNSVSGAIAGASSSSSSSPTPIDANYTVSHVDGTIILPSSSSSKRSASVDDATATADEQRRIRPELQLIKCLRFNSATKVAPFRVSITLSTLMCLQLHSLSATHEVMGFLGGKRTRQSAADGGLIRLNLTRYKPCETSAQSGTMCEMCPGK